MAASIRTLPVELLRSIFSHVSAEKDSLETLSNVCMRWRMIAYRIRYGHVRLNLAWEADDKTIYGALHKRPYLGRFVAFLEIYHDEGETEVDEEEYLDAEDIQKWAGTIEKMLSFMTNIKMLLINGGSGMPNEAYGWFAPILDNAGSRLHRLDDVTLESLDLNLLGEAGYREILSHPSLKSLQFENLADWAPPNSSIDLLPDFITTPSRLEYLVLINCGKVKAITKENAPLFPALKSVEISDDNVLDVAAALAPLFKSENIKRVALCTPDLGNLAIMDKIPALNTPALTSYTEPFHVVDCTYVVVKTKEKEGTASREVEKLLGDMFPGEVGLSGDDNLGYAFLADGEALKMTNLVDGLTMALHYLNTKVTLDMRLFFQPDDSLNKRLDHVKAYLEQNQQCLSLNLEVVRGGS